MLYSSRLRSVLLLGAGCVVGAVGALLLAWFMYFLISANELTLQASERVQMLDFVRVKREEAAERKDRKPERPDLQQAPDAPPSMEDANSSDAASTLAVSAPTVSVDGDLGLSRSGIGIGAGEGDYLPIVKIAPIYPQRALVHGITGTCTVRYTVTTAGTVKNVEIVPTMCEEEMFARPSLEAAKRFRYKPRVIDGDPVEVQGVYNIFHFEGKQAGEGQ